MWLLLVCSGVCCISLAYSLTCILNASEWCWPTVYKRRELRLLFVLSSLCPLAVFLPHSAMRWYALSGSRREKTCRRGFANITGADQPAHPRSLISAFVFRFLESIISRLATSEISIF